MPLIGKVLIFHFLNEKLGCSKGIIVVIEESFKIEIMNIFNAEEAYIKEKMAGLLESNKPLLLTY